MCTHAPTNWTALRGGLQLVVAQLPHERVHGHVTPPPHANTPRHQPRQCTAPPPTHHHHHTPSTTSTPCTTTTAATSSQPPPQQQPASHTAHPTSQPPRSGPDEGLHFSITRKCRCSLLILPPPLHPLAYYSYVFMYSAFYFSKLEANLAVTYFLYFGYGLPRNYKRP